MIVHVLSPRAPVIEAARRSGVGIVPIGTAEQTAALPPVSGHIEVSDPLNPLDVARALLASGVRPGDPRRVCLGLGDHSSQVASIVNSSLRLAGGRYGSLESLEHMRDKHRLREILGDSPVNGRYRLVNGLDSAAGVARFLDGCPGGVVVKPLDGSGSAGVVAIRSHEEAASLPATPGDLLVEERFRGTEYSVEGLTWDGGYHPLVVTEKRTGGATGLVETGQRQPAPLPAEHRDRLFAAAGEVLAVAGYRYGLSHVEFILQDGEPRLVEAHGRVGGDRIADLMGWSIGMTAFEVLFSAYRDDAATTGTPTGREAAIEFVDLSAWSGSDDDWRRTVRGIDGVVEALVLKAPGERSAIRASSDRHAHVVIAGDSIDDATRRIRDMENS